MHFLGIQTFAAFLGNMKRRQCLLLLLAFCFLYLLLHDRQTAELSIEEKEERPRAHVHLTANDDLDNENDDKPEHEHEHLNQEDENQEDWYHGEEHNSEKERNGNTGNKNEDTLKDDTEFNDEGEVEQHHEEQDGKGGEGEEGEEDMNNFVIENQSKKDKPVAKGKDGKFPSGRFLLHETFKHGLGHTLAEYNWGIAISQRYNLIRIPTPIVCGHGPGPDCNLLVQPELGEKVTLKQVDEALKAGHLQEVVISDWPREKLVKQVLLSNYTGNNLVFHFTREWGEIDYSETRKWWLKKINRAKKSPKWIFETPSYLQDGNRRKVVVTMHIRRGDLVKSFFKPGKEKLTALRFTPNDHYTKVMEILHGLFPVGSLVCYVVSQGQPEEFQDITQRFPETMLRLNQKAVDDFIFLMNSDILVTAKSGFSHLAAVLAPETTMKIAIPFWGSYSYLENVIMTNNENDTLIFDPILLQEMWDKLPEKKKKGVTSLLG